MSLKQESVRRYLSEGNSNQGLKEFFRWWREELLGMLPRWMRESALSIRQWVLLDLQGRNVSFLRLVDGKLRALDEYVVEGADAASQGIAWHAYLGKRRWGRQRQALCLGLDDVLVKVIELPVAVQENLAQTLVFEMDRHTPFHAKQVYFDYKILGRDTKGEKIRVQLAVVPSALVDERLEQLQRWGSQPVAVLWAGDVIEDGPHYNFMPANRRSGSASGLPWLIALLFLLAMASAVAALSIPLLKKRMILLQLQQVTANAQAEVGSVDNLQQNLSDRTEEYNYLQGKRQLQVPLTLLLNETADMFPADTWVRQWVMHGNVVEFSGDTVSTVDLVRRMGRSGFLTAPEFRAPITKAERPERERFHLAAQIQVAAFQDWKGLRKQAEIHHKEDEKQRKLEEEQKKKEAEAQAKLEALKAKKEAEKLRLETEKKAKEAEKKRLLEEKKQRPAPVGGAMHAPMPAPAKAVVAPGKHASTQPAAALPALAPKLAPKMVGVGTAQPPVLHPTTPGGRVMKSPTVPAPTPLPPSALPPKMVSPSTAGNASVGAPLAPKMVTSGTGGAQVTVTANKAAAVGKPVPVPTVHAQPNVLPPQPQIKYPK